MMDYPGIHLNSAACLSYKVGAPQCAILVVQQGVSAVWDLYRAGTMNVEVSGADLREQCGYGRLRRNGGANQRKGVRDSFACSFGGRGRGAVLRPWSTDIREVAYVLESYSIDQTLSWCALTRSG